MKPTPGITEPALSKHPLGTESEMTEGPDDYNPFDDSGNRANRDPTQDPDPFVFDDVSDAIGDVNLPAPDNGPQF